MNKLYKTLQNCNNFKDLNNFLDSLTSTVGLLGGRGFVLKSNKNCPISYLSFKHINNQFNKIDKAEINDVNRNKVVNKIIDLNKEADEKLAKSHFRNILTLIKRFIDKIFHSRLPLPEIIIDIQKYPGIKFNQEYKKIEFKEAFFENTDFDNELLITRIAEVINEFRDKEDCSWIFNFYNISKFEKEIRKLLKKSNRDDISLDKKNRLATIDSIIYKRINFKDQESINEATTRIAKVVNLNNIADLYNISIPTEDFNILKENLKNKLNQEMHFHCKPLIQLKDNSLIFNNEAYDGFDFQNFFLLRSVALEIAIKMDNGEIHNVIDESNEKISENFKKIIALAKKFSYQDYCIFKGVYIENKTLCLDSNLNTWFEYQENIEGLVDYIADLIKSGEITDIKDKRNEEDIDKGTFLEVINKVNLLTKEYYEFQGIVYDNAKNTIYLDSRIEKFIDFDNNESLKQLASYIQNKIETKHALLQDPNNPIKEEYLEKIKNKIDSLNVLLAVSDITEYPGIKIDKHIKLDDNFFNLSDLNNEKLVTKIAKLIDTVCEREGRPFQMCCNYNYHERTKNIYSKLKPIIFIDKINKLATIDRPAFYPIDFKDVTILSEIAENLAKYLNENQIKDFYNLDLKIEDFDTLTNLIKNKLTVDVIFHREPYIKINNKSLIIKNELWKLNLNNEFLFERIGIAVSMYLDNDELTDLQVENEIEVSDQLRKVITKAKEFCKDLYFKFEGINFDEDSGKMTLDSKIKKWFDLNDEEALKKLATYLQDIIESDDNLVKDPSLDQESFGKIQTKLKQLNQPFKIEEFIFIDKQNKLATIDSSNFSKLDLNNEVTLNRIAAYLNANEIKDLYNINLTIDQFNVFNEKIKLKLNNSVTFHNEPLIKIEDDNLIFNSDVWSWVDFNNEAIISIIAKEIGLLIDTKKIIYVIDFKKRPEVSDKIRILMAMTKRYTQEPFHKYEGISIDDNKKLIFDGKMLKWFNFDDKEEVEKLIQYGAEKLKQNEIVDVETNTKDSRIENIIDQIIQKRMN